MAYKIYNMDIITQSSPTPIILAAGAGTTIKSANSAQFTTNRKCILYMMSYKMLAVIDLNTFQTASNLLMGK